jgi:hypothetical protein
LNELKELRFCDIRQDWYYSNQLLPRLIRNSIHRTQQIKFAGFPRQWIPVFEYYGIPWRICSEPSEYMPIVSELSDDELARYSQAAKAKGTLRTLVESVSALDPLIADLLYIVDHSIEVSKFDLVPTESKGPKLIRLSSWQSYGRPEVLRFETAVDQVGKSNSVAVLLPCSRQRPYRASRTHKKIWQALTELGYQRDAVDQVVVTALGVVPESLWDHPAVLTYDAGVPDIYRVLRLARRFFRRNIYSHVIDCLQFAPYSDIFKILQREKIVKRLTRGPVTRNRQFYLKG